MGNIPYFYYPGYYQHPSYLHLSPYAYPVAADRQFNMTNPDMFIKSANVSLALLRDAEKLLSSLTHSRALSQKIMSAAQSSDMNEVRKLILRTGIQTSPDILFSPDGIRLDFHPKTANTQEGCCHIILRIKWMNF
ncbi:hypothetical protein ACFVHQ_18940 [Actinomycetes bacterium NPDC127524]